MPLLRDATAVNLGAQPVGAMYARGTQVWPTRPAGWAIEKIDANTLKVYGPPDAFYNIRIRVPYAETYGIQPEYWEWPIAEYTGILDATGVEIVPGTSIWFVANNPIQPDHGFRFTEIMAGHYAIRELGTGDATPVVESDIDGIGCGSLIGTVLFAIGINENNAVDASPISPGEMQQKYRRCHVNLGCTQYAEPYRVSSSSFNPTLTYGALTPSVAPDWTVTGYDNLLAFSSSHEKGRRRILTALPPPPPPLGSTITTEIFLWDSDSDPGYAANGWALLPFHYATYLNHYFASGNRPANPPNMDSWVSQPLPPLAPDNYENCSFVPICHYQYAPA